MKTVDTVAATGSTKPLPLSIPLLFIFWGGQFLLIQQVERFFLFPITLSIEPPTFFLILKTFTAGLVQDLAVTGGALVVGAVLALPIGFVAFLFRRHRTPAAIRKMFASCLQAPLGFIALTLVVIMMVDMTYYLWAHQRLNFVFFEYVSDVFNAPVDGMKEMQAAQQTTAELQNMDRFVHAGELLFLQGLALFVWWRIVHRILRRQWTGWSWSNGVAVNTAAVAVLAVLAMGASSQTIMVTPRIESDTYLMLAQNPILSSKNSVRAALFHQWEWVPEVPHNDLSVDEAVRSYQRSRGPDVVFPYQQYPFVGRGANHHVLNVRGQPRSRPNVLLIFVEGLDRRYVGRTIDVDHPIRVTPFLDRLKQDSLYFDNFFSNGVQTSRGLFATLCSYYPRHGAAAIKTRSTRDYLCLPALLRELGYSTEMVVGQHGAINNLKNFFTKNGIEHLYDIADFSSHAERMELGMTDAAIFDFMTARLRAARSSDRPLFLTTLTLSMHHPFVFPEVHEEVKALRRETDRYIPALRYFDSEFERFFSRLQREGLLKNTVVFVLGDHGRHEPQGRTDVERQVGHFMTPLFIWLDESLRTDKTYRPRTVDTIASQVDVAPTILAISHSEPTISPFVGHDLSCLLVEDCLRDNIAYITSVYDDLIGLVEEKGIWLYSFRKESLDWTDLAMNTRGINAVESVGTSSISRQLFSLYLSSNMLLEQDRIWSWPDFKESLYDPRKSLSPSAHSSLQPS